MSEELGDMTWEEFENEREKFEKAMSSLVEEIERNEARVKELERESIRSRAELDQLEQRVKHLKQTIPTLSSIITLVKDHLMDDYVGPTPTVEGWCLRILELYKRGDSND